MVQNAGSVLLSALRRLRPIAGVGRDDLEHALDDLRAAIDIHQNIVPLAERLAIDLPGQLRLRGLHTGDQLDGPLASALPGAASWVPTDATIVNIRSHEAGADPFAPAWTHGLRPLHSRGPFLDEAWQRF